MRSSLTKFIRSCETSSTFFLINFLWRLNGSAQTLLIVAKKKRRGTGLQFQILLNKDSRDTRPSARRHALILNPQAADPSTTQSYRLIFDPAVAMQEIFCMPIG